MSENDPYGHGDHSVRDTYCSGDETHSYQYGPREVNARSGDADFFIELLLVMIPMGAAGVTLIGADVVASRVAKRSRAAQAPASGPPAAA